MNNAQLIWLARTGPLDPEAEALFVSLAEMPGFAVEPPRRGRTSQRKSTQEFSADSMRAEPGDGQPIPLSSSFSALAQKGQEGPGAPHLLPVEGDESSRGCDSGQIEARKGVEDGVENPAQPAVKPVQERRFKELPADRIRLVFERKGVRLQHKDQVWRSHPGMGLVRLRRVLKGEPDPMLSAMEIQPGERVLDATFGYGHDSLLMAHAVGENGQVLALEANPALAALAWASLRYWPKPGAELMERLELLCRENSSLLRELPDRSVDLVYFDPMFRYGISAAPGFELLRMLGHAAALDSETLEQAKRVSRRAVVMKDAAPGKELKRLGLEMVEGRRNSRVVFGAWRR